MPAYKNDSSGLDTEELNKKFNDTLSNTGTFLQVRRGHAGCRGAPSAAAQHAAPSLTSLLLL